MSVRRQATRVISMHIAPTMLVHTIVHVGLDMLAMELFVQVWNFNEF